MLQRTREFLTLVLVALLPFHAFLVTVITKSILGSGHAPIAGLSLWKEMLLIGLLCIAFAELFAGWSHLKKKERAELLRCDALDLVILATALVAVIVSYFSHVALGSFLLGVRYDLLAPAAFILFRRVPWSPKFVHSVRKIILISAVLVSIMALASLFLPLWIFTAIGYSDLHSLYVPGRPIAPFQFIGDSLIRRAQGPMSGPNQLGMWLLLPLALAILELFRWIRARVLHGHFWQSLSLVLLFSAALFVTFSRSAWIAGAEIVLVSLLLSLSARQIKVCLSVVLAVGLLGFLALVSISPDILTRAGSTRGHLERPIAAWHSMWEHPWGQGLGTAGPATNRTSDACVMLEPEDNPAWAQAHPDLCVFVGTMQVQPLNRGCHCPFLPENWYLQFGVEMGVVGLVLGLLTPIAALALLWKRRALEHGVRSLLSAALGVSILGLGLAGFLLHVWEDTATAFTIWILLAVVLPRAIHRSLFQKLLGWLRIG